jgi:Bacterial membrane protein YfhO
MRLKGWHEWWYRRRADIAALAAVAFFFVGFFPKVLFGDRFIIAGDAYYYSYPLRTVAWRMIRHGELPLWTPYVLSGYPLLSMSQIAIGYPLTWGYLFLSGPWAEQLYVLAPFLLAPVFTYAYVRELRRSRLAALLAGLAFGYGGTMCGAIANSGMLTNGLMWTPLVLLFIDRARQRSLTYCLLWTSIAYSMSVLAGHGQSYVYVGLVAMSYGLFLSLSSIFEPRTPQSGKQAWITWSNLRPLLVALGALVMSAGVAAFQVLEALRAARRSVRTGLSYEAFGDGSFTLREALLSIGAPLYHYIDTSAYLTPLVLALAITAAVCAWLGRGTRDPRIWFWLAVAVVGFVLMLGAHTPAYRIVYHVPVLNSFRVPSRHTFEWTLAISILSAFGWDLVADYFERRRATTSRKLENVMVLLLFLIAGVVGLLWWRATYTPPAPNPSIYTGLPEVFYWLWKLAFTVVVFALAWLCFRLTAPKPRAVLLASVVLLACFVEQSATVACWWAERLSLDASRLQIVSPTTRYLQQLSPEQNRVYSRVQLYSEEFNSQPRLEAPNLPAIYGLHNVAGMEPLIFERYSRALGGVGPDSVTPRAGFPPNDDLFEPHSHVLDILNTTHVVSFTNLKPFEDALTLKDGIGIAVADLNITLPPRASMQLQGFRADTDVLALVTSLANSVTIEQDTPVARLRVHTAGGRVIEWDFRAGVDTAEWAHDRPDVHTIIRHRLASIFDGRPGDPANSFTSYRYWTSLRLDPRQQVEYVEITNVSTTASIVLWKVTLHDSTLKHSDALTQKPARVELDPVRWQTVAEVAGVFVLRNTRASPRAWLVSEAEAVDGEDALRRIRGESVHEFDPRRTALLEVSPARLPQLSGGIVSDTSVRISSYSANKLTLETEAPMPTILVVSEIFYPGWQANVDGAPTEILLTDYLLRGVVLPPGKHVVEMRYQAPAARNGAIISGLALCVLLALLTSAYLMRNGREHV